MADKEHVPQISIIMGIYNCENTLKEAIECILNQTFTDWELILCDDGSADGTYGIAQEYERAYPGKILVLQNEENKGLQFTLNRCLQSAVGAYIARMDGDDRCSPDRFEKELAVFMREPEIAIVSTDMELFDEKGSWGRVSHPVYPRKKDFVYGSPFCHAPCMVRREAYEKTGGYSEEKWLTRVEDYYLWIRMYAAGFFGKNIHLPLYQMRDDRNACARRRFVYRIHEALVRLYLVKALKLPVWNLFYAARPVLVGLLPVRIYDLLHKQRWSKGVGE